MKWRDVKKGNIPKKKVQNTIPNIAPIVNRIKAFLTDSFMIFMPICYFVIYIILGSREAFQTHMLYGWAYVLIPHYIITTLFLYYKGQTPGYKAYEIKLLTQQGKPVTLGQISGRYLLFTLSIAIFPLLFIPFFRGDKKMLHDLITKTYPASIATT
ncbi:RDD family protein [Sulfurospirillum sp. 1612]|uniref:RDD family protein n=1 Tax=Sulfurospirillum sp. 1612 TaxID=3094835 RepID=UPI002F92B9AC